MVQNYFAFLPVDGVLLHPIFVTGDKAAAFVAGRCHPGVVFQSEGLPFLSTADVGLNFPYYSDCFERLKELLRTRATATAARVARDAAQRFSVDPKGLDLDQRQLEAEIERLEEIVLATSSDLPPEVLDDFEGR